MLYEWMGQYSGICNCRHAFDLRSNTVGFEFCNIGVVIMDVSFKIFKPFICNPLQMNVVSA